jgi:uncharacterized protein YbaR (Trm112 family)
MAIVLKGIEIVAPLEIGFCPFCGNPQGAVLRERDQGRFYCRECRIVFRVIK